MSAKPPFFDLISRQFELLWEQRAGKKRELDEIDAKIVSVAETLGIELPGFEEPAALDRLPLRNDKRSDGSMSQFVRDFLRTTDRGHTRMELKEIVRAESEDFAAKVDRNANGYYNIIMRGIRKGEIVDIDGVLYDADRAPNPGVVNLFDPQPRALNLGEGP